MKYIIKSLQPIDIIFLYRLGAASRYYAGYTFYSYF